MRRLARILGNTAAALSLLLLIATAGLWVRSGATVASASTRRSHHIYSLDVHHGSVSLVSFCSRTPSDETWWLRLRGNYTFLPYPDLNFRWRRLRFGVQQLFFVMEARDEEPTNTLRTLTAPLWFVCAALLVVPLLTIRSMFAAHTRRTKGLCPSCGYDLRATPHRCPECGTQGGTAHIMNRN